MMELYVVYSVRKKDRAHACMQLATFFATTKVLLTQQHNSAEVLLLQLCHLPFTFEDHFDSF